MGSDPLKEPQSLPVSLLPLCPLLKQGGMSHCAEKSVKEED